MVFKLAPQAIPRNRTMSLFSEFKTKFLRNKESKDQSLGEVAVSASSLQTAHDNEGKNFEIVERTNALFLGDEVQFRVCYCPWNKGEKGDKGG